MKTRPIFMTAIIACTLSGCSLFVGDRAPQFAANGDETEMALDGYFAAMLERGRSKLKKGNVTVAIDAFRQASQDGTLAPDALNGLAVAYAQLGRNDLAKRYFQEAIALRPDDERFARNLARLEGPVASPAAPRRAETGQAPTTPLPTILPATVAPGPVAVAQDPDAFREQLRGVRRPDVIELATSKSAVARTEQTGARARVVVEGRGSRGFRPYARGAFRVAERSGPYPQRITLPATPEPAYPVRVAF